MPRLLLLATFCLLAGPALAKCPAPSDMAKGVSVRTVSTNGEQSTHVFRKTSQGRVDEHRLRQRLATSDKVLRILQRGLLPLEQRAIKSPDTGKSVQDEVYDYPGQHIARLQVLPKTEFTARSVRMVESGAPQMIETTYTVGPIRSQYFGRCRLRIMEITAVEERDGVETVYAYQYFERFGFAIEARSASAGKTVETKIIEIGPARP